MAKLGDYIRKGTKYQSKAAKKGHMQSLDKYEKDSVAENSRAGKNRAKAAKRRVATEPVQKPKSGMGKAPQKDTKKTEAIHEKMDRLRRVGVPRSKKEDKEYTEYIHKMARQGDINVKARKRRKLKGDD